MNDCGIAETNMNRGWPFHAIECSVEGLETVFARFLRPPLHVGLVYLNNVGAGSEQILDFRVHRTGIVQRHFLLVFVEIVLRLL